MTIPLFDVAAQNRSLEPHLSEAIEAVLASGHFIGGEAVTAFERDFAQYLGADHVVSCGNGTDALEIVLEALGIGEGDEVIVPAMTWVATAEAAVRIGAVPVFADVIDGEWTLDPAAVKRALTPRTRAVVPVHLYGRPARMDALARLCRERGLLLVEDCAQAHGAMIGEAKLGTLGDAAIFSFFPTKNLGALGDGGAMVVRDGEAAHRARLIATHGQEARHDHRVIGRNSRLDALHACVLSLKLPHLDGWIAAKDRLADRYRRAFADLPLELPGVGAGERHGWHLFAVTCEQRDGLLAHLGKQRIAAGIHYPTAVTDQPAFVPFVADPAAFPVARKLASTQLSVPLYPELSDDRVTRIITAIVSHFA